LEVIAEESGASDKGALVALDLHVAFGELDRHIVSSGSVVVSALGQ
jgi:hypothetical protein